MYRLKINLRMVEDMNDIFKMPLLFQITCGSIYLCIAEFITLTSNDSSVIVQFILALCNQMFRFYLYCRIGHDTCEKVLNTHFQNFYL